MIYVLDACAMLAYLKDEPGGEKVEGILLDASNQCYAHAINLFEVYYHIFRMENQQIAEEAVADLKSVGIVPSEAMNEEFWKKAGEFKARRPGNLPVGDAFLIAFAKMLNGTLVTTDHNDFDFYQQSGVLPVDFIR